MRKKNTNKGWFDDYGYHIVIIFFLVVCVAAIVAVYN